MRLLATSSSLGIESFWLYLYKNLYDLLSTFHSLNNSGGLQKVYLPFPSLLDLLQVYPSRALQLWLLHLHKESDQELHPSDYKVVDD